jgi:uncharacterized protein
MIFLNREAELDALRSAFGQDGASLFILYGRRRLGKTTLLREFSGDLPGVYHVADRSAEKQALRFLAQSMSRSLSEPTLASSSFDDWYSLFAAYDRLRPPQKSFLILDEYQYLCELQPAFSTYLQRWWDEHWKKSNLMLVLCGSLLSMMYRETLSRSSPLYGRRTGQWLLGPLRFRDAVRFYPALSPDEKVRMWALTGGVPYYCELAAPQRDFRNAFRRLVLSRDGPLYSEARFLLQDEVTTVNIYSSLLHLVGSGVSRISEIAARLSLAANQLTRYLTVLQELGLVRREVPVTAITPEKSKKGQYQVTDPFLRLWFGSVTRVVPLLELGQIEEAEKVMEDRVASHLSWSFEQVCLQYVEDRAVDWSLAKVGRYWDRVSEIDLVGVDAEGQVSFAGECKWSRRPVGVGTYSELKHKAENLWPHDKPRLALFSRSGFTPELQKSDGVLLIGCQDLG